NFFFQAEDGIRDRNVTGVQTCALPISVLPCSIWPSPRHDRFGLRVVTLSRLQASLDVAARVFAPRCTTCAASRALDAPLGHEGLPSYLGPATRRTDAYRGGTRTRWRGAACNERFCSNRSLNVRHVTTHHVGSLPAVPNIRPEHRTST